MAVESREVVGWGRLKLPGATADDPNESYDALLVRVYRARTVNFFLGGAPAPAPLITALGQTEGEVSRDTLYAFYAETEFGAPLMIYSVSFAFVDFRPMAGNLTSALSSSRPHVASAISPTLASPGAGVRVTFAEPLPPGSTLDLVGFDGRRHVTQRVVGRDAWLELPATLSSAPYLVVARDARGLPLSSGRIVVH